MRLILVLVAVFVSGCLPGPGETSMDDGIDRYRIHCETLEVDRCTELAMIAVEDYRVDEPGRPVADVRAIPDDDGTVIFQVCGEEKAKRRWSCRGYQKDWDTGEGV